MTLVNWFGLGWSLLALAPAFGDENVERKSEIERGASAVMIPRSGSRANGTVDFSDSNAGLQVHYKLYGLKKNRKLGFHIHTNGDCSSSDAKSAGMHFNKVGEKNGTSLASPQSFAGDMPQVLTDTKGNAEGTFLMRNLTLDHQNAIIGKAVILHGGPDNIGKPAAARIACGVVEPLNFH